MDKQIIANELFPIYETSDGLRKVDGRRLHNYLRSKQEFANWIKNRIERYDFKEGKDFLIILSKTSESGGRPSIEYDLTVGMAKELCMIENNDQGGEARKYFIRVEEQFKAERIDISKLDPNLQMFHHVFQSVAMAQLDIAETKRIAESANQKAEHAETTMSEIKETLLARDEDWRVWINEMLARIAERLGGGKEQHHDLRAKSYQYLKDRTGCKLDIRLDGLKARLFKAGASKTKIKQANKLDVIEEDRKLKEIYSSIVKELSIGTLR